MNYTENVKTKSLGLAIVLTLLFGPLGLFYASVSGGLIMSLTPLALLILLFIGAVSQSSILLASSAILLGIFALSYWVICVIWAATSVSNYNNQVINDARQEELSRILEENNRINNQIVPSVITKEITKAPNKQSIDQPTVTAWQKQNPHRSINDYYQIYGVPQSHIITPTYTYEEAYYIHEKPNNSWLYITIAIVLIILIAVITNPNEDKHKSEVKSKLISSKISNALTDKASDTGNSDKDAARRIGLVLGSVIGGSIVEEMVDNLVTTDNYIVFSTTNVNVKGKNKIIGFGAFGNVFLSDKLDLNLLYGSENNSEEEKALNKTEQELLKNENGLQKKEIVESLNNNNEQNLINLQEPAGTEWEVQKNGSELLYACFQDYNNPDLKISVCYDKNIKAKSIDRNLKVKFIKYKGQDEVIPLFFQNRENYDGTGAEISESSVQRFWSDTYTEKYRGKITGSFTFTNSGFYGLEVYFTRKRDGKEFYFRRIAGTEDESNGNENGYSFTTTPCF